MTSQSDRSVIRVALKKTVITLVLLTGFLLFDVAFLSVHVKGETEIRINLPSFTLELYKNGEVIRTYPIGIGSVVKPSLLGDTTIINKVADPTYYPPDWYLRDLEPIPPGPDNPVGTRWLGLGIRGYGIHGTNAPWSIGTAASAGCIRLFNEDVEELTELVQIGTTVTFLYETMDVWLDPVSDKVQLLVYGDVYHQGLNSIDRLIGMLNDFDLAAQVDPHFLQAIIDEAAGQPRSVPYSVPLFVNGQPFHQAAVEYEGQLLLPLKSLADHFGRSVYRTDSPIGEAVVDGKVVRDSIFIGQAVYAPVADTTRALGLIPDSHSSVALRHVQVVGTDNHPLDLVPFVDDSRLLLPASEIAELFGFPAEWPQVASIGRNIGNKTYLSSEQTAELFGIRIDWYPWQKTAKLLTASVAFSNSPREEVGFFYADEVLIPMRLVTDRLGLSVGWNDATKTAFIKGQPIPGIIRGGRTYVGVQAISNLIPELEYDWYDDTFRLELRMHGSSL